MIKLVLVGEAVLRGSLSVFIPLGMMNNFPRSYSLITKSPKPKAIVISKVQRAVCKSICNYFRL